MHHEANVTPSITPLKSKTLLFLHTLSGEENIFLEIFTQNILYMIFSKCRVNSNEYLIHDPQVMSISPYKGNRLVVSIGLKSYIMLILN